MKVVHAWILNGPNLNFLGVREPDIYGTQTMDQILDQIRLEYPLDRLDYFQTNHEGELIQKIQEWVPLPSTASDVDLPDFVLLNAGVGPIPRWRWPMLLRCCAFLFSKSI